MSERFHVRLPDGSEFGPVGVDVLREWAVQGRVTPDSMIVGDRGDETPAREHDVLAPIVNAPPTVRGAVPPEPKGDATGGLIPYKNMPALTSYYVGIGSLVALIVFPLGVIVGTIAVVLGINGLRLRRREPEVKGAAHAWTGIIIGGIVALLTLTILVIIAVSMLMAP